MPPLCFAHRGEAEGLYKKLLAQTEVALVEPHGVEAEDLFLGRDGALRPRSEFALVRGLDERESQPVRVGERQRAIAAARLDGPGLDGMSGESRLPERQRPDWNCECNLGGEASTVATAW